MSPRSRATHISLIRRGTRFQRSVNLKLDAGSVDRLMSFIPTPSLATATAAFFASAVSSNAQRAYHIYGAYGTGKSTLAVLLAAVIEASETTLPFLGDIIAKFENRGFSQAATLMNEYLASRRRLLPVLLSGDEGPIDAALLRGLKRALVRVGIPEVELGSSSHAAVAVIRQWQQTYPQTYSRFAQLQEEQGRSVQQFVTALERDEPSALHEFVMVYPQLTSGARFDPGYGQTAVAVYQSTAEKLTKHGYSGICVLFDEFGRYLEGLVARVGYRELAYLQEFSELCSSTTQHPVHLVLFGHKTFGEYANSGRLDNSIQTEWRRIEGRFLSVRISTDPDAAYYLMAEALNKDPDVWGQVEASHRQHLENLRVSMFDHLMFPGRSSSWIDEFIIRGAYPLHPVAAACLPLLSQEVAQNERTIFTFLTADEPGGLCDLLERKALEAGFRLITLDQVYDYFAPAIRADLGPGGKHPIWLAANRTLGWVHQHDSLPARLVKALAALHAAGLPAELRPNTGLLAFAVRADFKETQEALNALRDAKMLVFRQNAGYWDFFSGSSIDVASAIDRTIEANRFGPEKLRRILGQLVRAQGFVAGLHNESFSIRRRFPLEYITMPELRHIGGHWDKWLDERQADGVVLGVLADTPHEVQAAVDLAQAVDHPRILFTIPKEPLRVFRSLRNYAAVVTLQGDQTFLQQDPLLADELRFHAQEEADRIEEELEPLLDPLDSQWFYRGAPVPELRSPRQVNSLVSRICDQVYAKSIPVRYEPVNRRRPSSTIANAVRVVVEELIKDNPLPANLGLTGKGPEVMLYQTILVDNGFTGEDLSVPESPSVVVGQPNHNMQPNPHAIWTEIHTFCQEAQKREVRIGELIAKLVQPPYGLRPGVIPVLLAAGMRDYLGVATLRQGFQPIKMILGSTFLDMVDSPDQFTLRIETVQACIRTAMLRLLDESFARYVTPADRRGQPVFVYARGLHRWWQGLDRFARETTRLTQRAASFRRLARNAFDQPVQVVHQALPALLLPQAQAATSSLPEQELYEALCTSLLDILHEIDSLLPEVRRRIRATVCDLFDPGSVGEAEAVGVWVTRLQEATGVNVLEQAFNDVNADGLLRAIRIKEYALLERLVKFLIGVDITDWTDQTEVQFADRLRAAKEVIEQELARRPEVSSQMAATLTLDLPGMNALKMQYTTDRPLSPAAASLLTFLINSFENQNKTLTLEERRHVAADFLKHVVAPE